MKRGELIILLVFTCIAGAYGKAKPHVTPASETAESKRCLGMKLNNWGKMVLYCMTQGIVLGINWFCHF